jgi:hypothetical protein
VEASYAEKAFARSGLRSTAPHGKYMLGHPSLPARCRVSVVPLFLVFYGTGEVLNPPKKYRNSLDVQETKKKKSRKIRINKRITTYFGSINRRY